jgi:hypothetical protein
LIEAPYTQTVENSLEQAQCNGFTEQWCGIRIRKDLQLFTGSGPRNLALGSGSDTGLKYNSTDFNPSRSKAVLNSIVYIYEIYFIRKIFNLSGIKEERCKYVRIQNIIQMIICSESASLTSQT